MSYGYSIWYIPENYEWIQKTYNMNHIPHFTIQTNLKDMEEATEIYNKLNDNETMTIQKDCQIFESMYENDPLQGIGWYIKTNINMRHKAHLTIKYYANVSEINDKDFIEWKDEQKEQVCFKAIVDTLSIHPERWKILRQATR